MEKEKVKKRANEKILEQSNKTKKIRTSSTSEIFGLKFQDPVDRFQENPPEVDDSSLEFLLEGLTHVALSEQGDAMLTKNRFNIEEYRESPSTSRDSFSPISRITAAPKLPVAMDSDDALASEDVISDDDSDFYPDWSSANSCLSSALTDDCDLRNDGVLREGVVCSPDELLSRFSEENYLGFNDALSLPIPAAGNEYDRAASSQTASSDGRASPVTKFKPQAIRRVKSMILETSKDDEIDPCQRSRMLSKKRDVATPSLIAVPSPLLTAEDAGSLKRSPSQLSAKFSLKRSRSNLAIAESSVKRHHVVDSHTIHEESDDDASDLVTDSEMDIKPARKKYPDNTDTNDRT